MRPIVAPLKLIIVPIILAAFVISVLITNTAGGQPAAAISRRMQLNLDALGINALPNADTVSGDGVLIAIVDTGIDPAHPALQFTPDGRSKIVDWVDFSGRDSFGVRAEGVGSESAEGDVRLQKVSAVGTGGDRLPTPAGTVGLGALRSVSGVYAVGAVEEQSFTTGEFGGDLNGDGSNRGRFAVVAVDTRQPGFYDAVLVDTNGDGDLADEVPLKPFRFSRDYAHFRSDESEHITFVVTDLAPSGTLVNLGFDGAGHGTHVAGIAAGFDPGVFRGVAHGAQLLALKALSSAGQGSWSQIAAAVDYAVAAGAEVITISIDALTGPSAASGVEGGFLEQAAQACRCLIVVAAGNDGPGVASSAAPGNAGSILTVGAYYTPDMIEVDYGYRPSEAGVWFFSGAGPRADGSLSPNVIAPGGAVSAVPHWLSPDGYQLAEGTSVAAPHVAGAAALLLEIMKHQGRTTTGKDLLRAFEYGAEELPGFNALEQGYGAVNLAGARAVLAQSPQWQPVVKPDVEDDSRFIGSTNALLMRSGAPGSITWRVGNVTTGSDLLIDTTAAWVRPDRRQLRLVPGSERSFELYYDEPPAPGLYTAWVRLTGNGGRTDLLQALVSPWRELSSGRPVTQSGTLEPGRWQRVFVDVPIGTSKVIATLKNGGDPIDGHSRPVLFAYHPDGTQWLSKQLPGPGAGSGSPATTLIEIDLPQPGVWEFVVYLPFPSSGATARMFTYDLRVEGSGVVFSPNAWFPTVGQSQSATATLNTSAFRLTHSLDAVVFGLSANEPATINFHQRASAKQPVYKEARVPAGTGLLEVVATSAQGADVSLYVYRKVPGDTPAEVVRSVRPGESVEVARSWFPRTGNYIIWAETDAPADDRLQLSIRMLPAVTTGIEARGTPHGGTVTTVVRPPSDSGRLHGALAIEDVSKGYMLAVMPILIDGSSTTTVTVQAAPALTPGAYWLTVRLADSRSRRPLAGQVVVDGRPYTASNGSVTIRRTRADGEPIHITAIPMGRSPVATTWHSRSLVAFGTGPAPSPGTNHSLHRKLVEQMQR